MSAVAVRCLIAQPHRSRSIRGQTESQILYEIKLICSCSAALMLCGWPREVNGRYNRYVERIIASGVSRNALLRPECPPNSCFGLEVKLSPNIASNESHGLEKSNQMKVYRVEMNDNRMLPTDERLKSKRPPTIHPNSNVHKVSKREI